MMRNVSSTIDSPGSDGFRMLSGYEPIVSEA